MSANYLFKSAVFVWPGKRVRDGSDGVNRQAENDELKK
jgi:hypothetical protein